jgi:hypothetical protein
MPDMYGKKEHEMYMFSLGNGKGKQGVWGIYTVNG